MVYCALCFIHRYNTITVLGIITLYIILVCSGAYKPLVVCLSTLALLNITPSANNGTFGALHHMLKPAVADALPPGTVYIIHVYTNVCVVFEQVTYT